MMMDVWISYFTIGAAVGLFLMLGTVNEMNQNPTLPMLPIHPGMFGFVMFCSVFIWPILLLLLIYDMNDRS